MLGHAQAVLNDGFDLNPMFVPVTMEEFMFQAKDMMYIIDERLSHMAFYKNEPIGVLVCIPDLNPLLKKIKSRIGLLTLFHYFKYLKNRDRAIIIFYSVKKKYHSLGVNGVLLCKTLSALKQAGYKKMGCTWIADTNTPSLRQVEKMGMQDYHKTTLFKKSI